MGAILKDVIVPIVVGVIVSVLGDLITRKRLRGKVQLRRAIMVVVIFIVISGVFVYVYKALNQSYLKIVLPEPNAQIIADQVIVSGTSSGLSQRKVPLNIYLLVHPMRSGSKFVQANFGPPTRDGSWQQIAALGGLDEFEIWAIASEDPTIKGVEYPLSHRFHTIAESRTIRIRRIK